VVSMPATLITSYLAGINELRAVTAIYGARGVVPLVAGFAPLPSLGLGGIGIPVGLGGGAGPLSLRVPPFPPPPRAFDPVPAAPAWRPVVVGSLATSLFLLAQALHSPHAGAIYALALAGTLASTAWSWARVGSDVRERSLGLLRRIAS